MGVLQRFPHPLPIKTDSGNNILIYSPELDGPAHAAQPFSSWADLSVLQSLPPEIPTSLIGSCAGLAGLFQAGLIFAHGPGREATPWAGPRRAAGFGVLSNSDIVPRSYWWQWYIGIGRISNGNTALALTINNLRGIWCSKGLTAICHGYVRNKWQMSRRGAGMPLSPGAFYNTNHFWNSQMEAPYYTSPRLEQNCDIPLRT